MTTTDRFNKQKQLVNDTGDLVAHILDSLAMSSEKTIASMVLLLSTLPEYFGMAAATQNRAVAVTAALISVVVVKLALRDISLGIPLVGKRKLTVSFWVLYLAQIGAGIAFIANSGTYIDIGLIIISLVGAVSSEEIAKVIKREIAERTKASAALDLQAAKDKIRLDSFAAKEQAKTAAFVAKHAPAEPEQPQMVTDAAGSEMVISAEKNAQGREKGRKTQASKAQARRDDLYEKLIEQYPGVEMTEIRYSAIAKLMNVSADTAKRDVMALRDEGRINGRVPEGRNSA